jgi:hypothetical protein
LLHVRLILDPRPLINEAQDDEWDRSPAYVLCGDGTGKHLREFGPAGDAFGVVENLELDVAGDVADGHRCVGLRGGSVRSAEPSLSARSDLLRSIGQPDRSRISVARRSMSV